MLMVQIKPLTGISTEQLYGAHHDAFSGYARSWTVTEFKSMLQRRGYAPHLSVGAFTDNEELVSFTLIGTGLYNKLETAYDVSTGTIRACRGQGLAARIFDYSLPLLTAAGIQQCLLEVLQTNMAAITLYRRLGFIISRELTYFIQNDRELILQRCHNHGHQLQSVHLGQIVEMITSWDFVPSWQNSLDALSRTPDAFKAIGFF